MKIVLPDFKPSPVATSPIDRVPSPDQFDASGKVRISGPINGAPIPSGFKCGGKDIPSTSEAVTAEQREKVKSQPFWGFGKTNGIHTEFHIQIHIDYLC